MDLKSKYNFFFVLVLIPSLISGIYLGLFLGKLLGLIEFFPYYLVILVVLASLSLPLVRDRIIHRLTNIYFLEATTGVSLMIMLLGLMAGVYLIFWFIFTRIMTYFLIGVVHGVIIFIIPTSVEFYFARKTPGYWGEKGNDYLRVAIKNFLDLWGDPEDSAISWVFTDNCLKKALVKFQKGLQISNLDERLLKGLASTYFYLRRYQDAIENFLKIQNSLNPRCLYLLAVAFEKLDNDTKALEYFTEYLKKLPEDVKGNLHLGSIYLRKGDYEKASEQFQKVITLRPDVIDKSKALIGLGECNLLKLQHANPDRHILVIVDAPNQANLDLEALRDRVREIDRNARLIFYYTNNSSKIQHQSAFDLGFEVIWVPKKDKDVDSYLQNKIYEYMKHSQPPNLIIIGAGDKDYVPLINNLRREWKDLEFGLAVGSSNFSEVFEKMGVEIMHFPLLKKIKFTDVDIFNMLEKYLRSFGQFTIHRVGNFSRTVVIEDQDQKENLVKFLDRLKVYELKIYTNIEKNRWTIKITLK